MASLIAGGDASRGLGSLTPVFHWPNSSAAWRSWPRNSATSATTPGSEAGHQLACFLALGVARQQPAPATGDVDQVGTSLVEDQVQVPAEGSC
jgi:hypothetical protein